MNVSELVSSIVDGSFDAGVVVNENGSIVAGNSAAHDLFSMNGSAESGSEDKIESHLFDWKIPGMTQFHLAERDTQWKAVKSFLSLTKAKGVPREWRATGKKGRREFSVRVKITVFGDASNALLFIRPVANVDSTHEANGETLNVCPVSNIVVRQTSSVKDSDSIAKSTMTSNQHLTSLISAMTETCLDPMFQINEKGVIIMANRAAVKQFGWSREEFLGSNISMIAGDDHGKNHDSYIQRYLETGETKVIGKRRELKARKKDRSEFPIELAVTEVETFQGDQRLFCGFVRDLTDIKRKQSLSTGIIEASLDPILVVDATSGTIQMSNAAATKQFGWSEEEFLGRDIRSLVRLEDVNVFFPENGGMKTELLVRRKNGTIFPVQLGVVEIDSHGDKQLLCETFYDLSSIKREASFKAGAMEASLDPMFQINEKGIIQRVNKAATHVFGWTTEEFLGSNISMIAGGAHRKYHDEYILRYLKTGEKRVIGKKRELAARRKDGSELRIELGVTELDTDYGGEHLFCGYVHDVTRIKKSERLFAGIIEASLDPMFQINDAGNIQMVNDAAVRLFGWTRQEFLGRNISMIVGGGHAQNHDHYMRRYLKTGETRVIGKKRELPARRKDGFEFPIELGVAEIKTDSREERLFCGFVRDVSEMKKVERFSNGLFESSLDPMFQITDTGVIKQANTAAVHTFGWSHEELVGKDICVILVESKENSGKLMQRYFEAGQTRKKLEVSVSRRDGSEFPAELGIVPFTVDLGDSRHFLVIVRDLSVQTKREKELRQNEALTNRILQTSLSAIVVTDQNGVIHRVNETAADVFGWSTKQLCHETIGRLFPPEDTAMLREEFARCCIPNEPGPVQHECRAIKSSGSRFLAMATVRKVEGLRGPTLFAIFIEESTGHFKMTKTELQQTVAEALLLNVLPDQVVQRFRKSDPRLVQRHHSATILVAEIVGSASNWDDMEPDGALMALNELFAMLDNIVGSYDLTKVKASGACYMVTDVSGEEREQNGCSQICHMALDMMKVFQHRNEGSNLGLDFRVGIHIGPIFAGVTQSMYDIWGDAVNVASQVARTCSTGEVRVTREVVDAAGNSLSFGSTGSLTVNKSWELETMLLLDRTHRLRQMRRPSFYNRSSRFRSFLPEGHSRLALGDLPCRMDLYQALHTLELLPASFVGDDAIDVCDWSSGAGSFGDVSSRIQ